MSVDGQGVGLAPSRRLGGGRVAVVTGGAEFVVDGGMIAGMPHR
jgi:hypothetical protein